MTGHYITGGSGTIIYVKDTGNLHGKPILFVHGLSQSHLCWKKQFQSDMAKEFRLLAMDTRGHGWSEKPLEGYDNPKNFADDIEAVITTLHLHQPVLVGWSRGGVLVCDYLEYYGEEKLSGIHLVSASTSIGTKNENEFMSPKARVLSPGLVSDNAETSSRTLQEFVRQLFFYPPPISDYYFALGYSTIVPPYVRRGYFTPQNSKDDILSRIAKPVLLTHGMEDNLVLLKQAIHNQHIIPHACTSFYPCTGHSPFWENSTRFNKELAWFAGTVCN